jgi:hypothetical protein
VLLLHHAPIRVPQGAAAIVVAGFSNEPARALEAMRLDEDAAVLEQLLVERRLPDAPA